MVEPAFEFMLYAAVAERVPIGGVVSALVGGDVVLVCADLGRQFFTFKAVLVEAVAK